jgi:hypothetical protein
MKYNEYGVPARQSLTARSVADAIRETLAPPRATSCTWLAMNELSRSWRCPIPEMATWEAWSLAHRSVWLIPRNSRMMTWALGRSARYFRYLTDNERTVTSTWCSTCARPGKRLPQKRRTGCLRLLTTLYGSIIDIPEIILKIYFINTGYM